jgi:hypothetical protein
VADFGGSWAFVVENCPIFQFLKQTPSSQSSKARFVWHYFRCHYWANRGYSDYDDWRCSTVAAWQKAALDPEVIESVCRAKFA